MQIDLEYVVMNLAADLGLDNKTQVYVLSRLRNEGVHFLTCVLPQLSKAMLSGLETGKIKLPCTFANEKWCFTRYFRDWLLKIFTKSGVVRENPCPVAIGKLRQFCEYFYKFSIKHNDKQVVDGIQKYMAIESELSELVVDPAWVETLRKSFHRLYPEFITTTMTDFLAMHRPRYTSGAFYGSESLPSDTPYYVYKHLPDFITGTCYKHHKAISGYFRSIKTRFQRIFFNEDISRTVKVLFVPKDSRGPRVISKEPLHLVRLQMSYFDNMVSRLERLSSNRINFLSQDVNRRLAYLGSLDRECATLDLKDASDRVSSSLVRRVFRDSPALSWFFDNARSSHAFIETPSKEGIKIKMNKLAGMGSGLTFPTMALLIHLSISASVASAYKLPLEKVAMQVYVYGDDVIIPSKWYNVAVQGLVASGLCVNHEKSFVNSFFRESCGADYYKGTNVTPVRIKLSNAGLNHKSFRKVLRVGTNALTGKLLKYKTWCFYITNDTGLFQLDRHCRELVKAGFISTSNYYYGLLERKFGKDYGYCSGDSPVMGRYSVAPIYINDDYRHFRWMPSPETTNSEEACPYKFLANSLKRVGLEVDEGLGLGSFAKPRSIVLRKVLVPSIVLR